MNNLGSSFVELIGGSVVVIVGLIVWSLIWKGLALWKAARLSQKKWFVAMLVINTLGILEIVYLFWISKDYKVEIVEEN